MFSNRIATLLQHFWLFGYCQYIKHFPKTSYYSLQKDIQHRPAQAHSSVHWSCCLWHLQRPLHDFLHPQFTSSLHTKVVCSSWYCITHLWRLICCPKFYFKYTLKQLNSPTSPNTLPFPTLIYTPPPKNNQTLSDVIWTLSFFEFLRKTQYQSWGRNIHAKFLKEEGGGNLPAPKKKLWC